MAGLPRARAAPLLQVIEGVDLPAMAKVAAPPRQPQPQVEIFPAQGWIKGLLLKQPRGSAHAGEKQLIALPQQLAVGVSRGAWLPQRPL